jgi:hypothetical protein
MRDVDTKFNQDVGHWSLVSDTSVFMHGVKITGSDRRQDINDEMMDKLVWYVLNNCEEVAPYLEYLFYLQDYNLLNFKSRFPYFSFFCDNICREEL